MKTYIVTHGDYSDYSIHGVFTDKAKAEEFAEYHNLENVEEWDTNPEVPVHHKFLFECSYSFNSDKTLVYRVGNDTNAYGDHYVKHELGWTDTEWCRSTIDQLIYAKDVEHARKIWQDTVRAFKAGQTTAEHVYYDKQVDVVKTLDVRERPKTHTWEITETVMWRGHGVDVIYAEIREV